MTRIPSAAGAIGRRWTGIVSAVCPRIREGVRGENPQCCSNSKSLLRLYVAGDWSCLPLAVSLGIWLVTRVAGSGCAQPG